jgi:hypothetical protein
MTYDQLLYRAYSLAIRLPQLGIVNDITYMTAIELHGVIYMMTSMLDS